MLKLNIEVRFMKPLVNLWGKKRIKSGTWFWESLFHVSVTNRNGRVIFKSRDWGSHRCFGATAVFQLYSPRPSAVIPIPLLQTARNSAAKRKGRHQGQRTISSAKSKHRLFKHTSEWPPQSGNTGVPPLCSPRNQTTILSLGWWRLL